MVKIYVFFLLLCTSTALEKIGYEPEDFICEAYHAVDTSVIGIIKHNCSGENPHGISSEIEKCVLDKLDSIYDDCQDDKDGYPCFLRKLNIIVFSAKETLQRLKIKLEEIIDDKTTCFEPDSLYYNEAYYAVDTSLIGLIQHECIIENPTLPRSMILKCTLRKWYSVKNSCSIEDPQTCYLEKLGIVKPTVEESLLRLKTKLIELAAGNKKEQVRDALNNACTKIDLDFKMLDCCLSQLADGPCPEVKEHFTEEYNKESEEHNKESEEHNKESKEYNKES